MFQELISDFKAVTESTQVFNDVIRGRAGEAATVKPPAVLILPDFDSLKSFGEEGGDESQLLPLTITSFVLVSGMCETDEAMSLEDVENDCMEKAYTLIKKIGSTSFVVTQDGNPKTEKWKLTRVEWVKRSLSECIIGIEHRMDLQI